MSIEDLVRTLVESITPDLTSGATAWMFGGFGVGFIAGLALYGFFHTLGVWRMEHSFGKALRPIAALCLATLTGAGCGLLFGGIGVQRGVMDVLRERPEVQQIAHPMAVGVMAVAQAAAASGPLVDAEEPHLQPALEQKLAPFRAAGYAMPVSEVPSTLTDAAAFMRREDARFAKPAIIDAVNNTAPESAQALTPNLVDLAFEMANRSDHDLSSHAASAYASLQRAAAIDGDPDEITASELGGHLVTEMLGPIVTQSLGLVVAGVVLTGLVPIGFLILLVPAMFLLIRMIFDPSAE